MQQPKDRLQAFVDHALVFAGDLLPYGVIFLMTVMVGYGLGLDSAGYLSVTYVYVAIVTGLVCSPNLLSIRRRMPRANSPGAVVLSALGLRTSVISIGAILTMCSLHVTMAQPGMLHLMALLFLGRLFETSIDSPATSIQYLRGPRAYFLLRLTVFVLIFSVTSIGVITAGGAGLKWVATCYLAGSLLGLMVALVASRRLLFPISGLATELKAQSLEFSKFFLATGLFLIASRFHPIIISLISGHQAAGQFAMVQNLFSALAMATTGIAGVFFWSHNRAKNAPRFTGMPWLWLAWAVPAGLVLGISGGFVLDFLYLKPLGSQTELRTVAWALCMSTPLLLVQSILSNQLVLLKRDKDMLILSAVNASIGLLLIALLVNYFGLLGAALSVSASAFLSSLFGVLVVRRSYE